MARRTKIIATIGPASQSESTLRGMIEAGMDVARIGLAHGTLDEQVEKFRMVRSVASELGNRGATSTEISKLPAMRRSQM